MKLGLQNFQGIGAYTEIPIAPITLFYGPNSAGKSTVADAFQFLRSTLSGKNKNWREDLTKHARRNRVERPLGAGDKYIGEPCDVAFTVEGCANLESNSFWDFAVSEFHADAEAWTETHEGIEQIFPDGKEFEIKIYFAQKRGSWGVRESLLLIDKQPLFKFYNDRDGNESFPEKGEFAFNVRHPAYQHLDKLDNLICWWFFDHDSDRILRSEVNVDETICWRLFGGENITEIGPAESIEWDVEALMQLKGANDEVETGFRILSSHLNFFSAMPARWAAVNYALHEVPPLRPLPEATIGVRDRYHFGECWEQLADDIRRVELDAEPKELTFRKGEPTWVIEPLALNFINEVLTSPDFLNTGYALAGDVKFKFEFDIDELESFVRLEQPELQERILDTPAAVKLHLVYKSKAESFQVEIADVGMGISQVIPVIYACWLAKSLRNGVYIQQPELHLHPKLQAQLADVFIKSINTEDRSGVFLLESHSEHMLLRMLRRIRESHMATLNRGDSTSGSTTVTNIQSKRGFELKANQVSVVYVSKDEAGITRMKPLRLSEDGDFIDRWPHGFFTERDFELFGEDGPFA